MKSRTIMGVVISGLVMFMLAGLWNLVIIQGLELVTIDETFLRENPILPLVALGYVFLAGFIRYVADNSSFSNSTLKNSLVSGVIVMEAAFGLSAFVLQGYYNFPLEALPLDLLWYLVEGVVGGYIVYLFQKS